MEAIMNVWNWIILHGVDIVAGFGLIVLIATFIAKLTPTPKDDEVVGKVKTYFLKALDFLKIGYPKYDL